MAKIPLSRYSKVGSDGAVDSRRIDAYAKEESEGALKPCANILFIRA